LGATFAENPVGNDLSAPPKPSLPSFQRAEVLPFLHLTNEFFGLFGFSMEARRRIKLAGEPETSGQVSIPQAARALGLDAFTFCTLVQRGCVKVIRAYWGELVVPKAEVNRLASKE
jgi:hypothetical protein